MIRHLLFVANISVAGIDLGIVTGGTAGIEIGTETEIEIEEGNYSQTSLKQSPKRRQKIGFQDRW